MLTRVNYVISATDGCFRWAITKFQCSGVARPVRQVRELLQGAQMNSARQSVGLPPTEFPDVAGANIRAVEDDTEHPANWVCIKHGQQWTLSRLLGPKDDGRFLSCSGAGQAPWGLSQGYDYKVKCDKARNSVILATPWGIKTSLVSMILQCGGTNFPFSCLIAGRYFRIYKWLHPCNIKIKDFVPSKTCLSL